MALDLGSRITELRSARGLSQEALANELGLSRQAVSRWERGEALPDTENLIALADLFEVTLDELVRPQAVETPEEQAAPAEETTPEAAAEDAPEAVTTPEPEAGPEPEPNSPADTTSDLSAATQDDATASDETVTEAGPEAGEADAPAPDAAAPTPPSVPTYTPPSETPPAAAPRDSRWTTGKVVALIVVAFIAGAAILALLARLILGMRAPLGAIQSASETPGVAYEAPDDFIDENDVSIDSLGITSIELAWPSGDVTIMPVDDQETGGDIRLLENRYDSDSDDALTWEVSDGTLKVYADPGVSYIGDTSIALQVPASVIDRLDEVSVGILSGSVEVSNIVVDDLDVTIGSGFANVVGVEARDFDLEVASGEAYVEGMFEDVDIDVLSGFAQVTVWDAPRLTDLSLEVASGNLVLSLPESAGFTLIEQATGSGGVIVSGFPITYSSQSKGTVGSGSISIEAEVASGTIEIVSLPE